MNTSEQKTVVIGGISGGIGSALAEQLCRTGDRVVGFARNTQGLEAVRARHPEIEVHSCDATDPEALSSCFEQIIATHGQIDAYAHAIGSIFIKPAHLTSTEDWHHTVLTNLGSAFYALRAATKHMSRQSRGSCLFFSTAAAQVGIANHEAIAAAKGGIEAMVRSAAATYAPRGLRINAIAPSLTDTPLAGPMISNPKMLEISKRMHPLGDIAQPADIASLAEWLLSANARFVTGQVFTIDGGISTIVPKPKI
jgi:NAD(P)-dependent dehydrogenase (short-subunit alcohol dehydrogenase family)